jgi:hypothetical protein
MRGLDACMRERILTGVGDERLPDEHRRSLHESWLRELIKRGVHYCWFHTYRPVGPKMNPQLALTPEQLVRVGASSWKCGAKVPIAIIDAYYDGEGKALCPMSTGISHHVNPRGDIEPCPIIQFATENIRDERGVFATMRDSSFLKDFRELSAQHTRGCVVLERPDLVKDLVVKHGARDTTMRGTAMAELEAMEPRFSQWLPGEKSRAALDVSLGEDVLVQRLQRLRRRAARGESPRGAAGRATPRQTRAGRCLNQESRKAGKQENSKQSSRETSFPAFLPS